MLGKQKGEFKVNSTK